jgi:release factor H-coupled RctB family protein
MKPEIKYFCSKDSIEKNAQDSLDSVIGMDKVCVFPDIHYCAEKAIPVGVAFSATDKFFPLITGKDIGCGVNFLRFRTDKWKKPFDKHTHYNAFNKAHKDFTDEGLGGGNHFLSIETGDDEFTYIICHTGTRNLGIYMYQQLALKVNEFNIKEGTTGTSLPIELYTEELHNEYNRVVDTGIHRRTQFVEKTFDFLTRNGYINAGTSYEISDSVHNVFRVDGKKSFHRKGATELSTGPVVIPMSMTRGSLIVMPKPGLSQVDNLNSCSHGAGRALSRTDTLKHWHSLKKKDKKTYEEKFVEMLDRNGKFPNGYLQEFDFAYKNSDEILTSQPFLKLITKTNPIVTVKFTEI